MGRSLSTWAFSIIAAVSFGIAAMNFWNLATNPVLTFFVSREAASIEARIHSRLSRAATPERIETRLAAEVAKPAPNWLVIESLRQISRDRNLPLDPELIAGIEARYADAHSLVQKTVDCVACAWSTENCELSAILICRAPVDLTPVGDAASVIRESKNYVTGAAVDKIDLTLASIGLGATVIAPLTGGSSLALKLGATTLKTTRNLGRLSPQLTAILARSAENAFDWQLLARSSPSGFPQALTRAINRDALSPVLDTLNATADMRASIGVPQTLHLIRFADTPLQARAFSQISQVLGAKTLGTVELLGKSRLMRTTMRYSDEVLKAIWATVSAILALAWLVASSVLNVTIRKRLTRRKSRPLAQSRALE